MIENYYDINNETGCEYRRYPKNETINPTLLQICNAFYSFNKYYLILVIIVGLIGNSLTILIFFRSKFTFYNRTKFYLICLAVSDIIYLVTLFFVWLDYMELLHILNYNYACQISIYITYISSFMSTQLVVAFTSQRLFSICFPLKKNKIENKSKFIVFCLILFACLFYNYAFWGYNSECPDKDDLGRENAIPRCKARKKFENLVDELDLADSVFTFIFPFSGILIMNLIIIRKLRQSNYDFILCTTNSYHSHNTPNNNNNNNNNCNNNTNNRNRIRLNNKKLLKRHLNDTQDCDMIKQNDSDDLNGIKVAKKINNGNLNYNRSSSSSVYVFREPKDQYNGITQTRCLSNYRFKTYHNNQQAQSNSTSFYDNKTPNKRLSSVFLTRSPRKFNKNSLNDNFTSNCSGSVSYKVTKMLICVSTVFLLLNLPYHTFKLYAYIRIRLTNYSKYTYAESCIIHFLQQIFNASFSCNFFLYSISGVAFRNELKDFMSSFIKRKR